MDIRGHMTFTPVAERLAVGQVTTCFYSLDLSRLGIEPRFPATLYWLILRGGFNTYFWKSQNI